MVVDTINEKLCVNKLVATKKEILLIEGDMIVPDSKPDILSTICTSGVVCIYKKDILTGKIRIDGNIDTNIMYLADDSRDKVRGICTNLDFSETINISNVEEGMNAKVETKLKTIECKVINGRKIGVKAAVEVNINVYANEDIEIINDIQDAQNIQMLKEDLKVNSLVGMGETKIHAKDTIMIDNVDQLAEILKSNICICEKDIKISYNKILTKAEADVKLMYLTEDNRICHVETKIPIVGFIDIPNVTEDNICDVDYEIRNILIKPNSAEEHSIYVEIEACVSAVVYEEKQINLIQDLYSPVESLEFNKKRIHTITDKSNQKEQKQIRERIQIEGLQDKEIIDVEVTPFIEKEEKLDHKIKYECTLELNILLSNQDLQTEAKVMKIPFEHVIENIEHVKETNNHISIEVTNKDFVIQSGGEVTTNIDLSIENHSYKDIKLNIMNEIQTTGEREEEDYSIVMYIVKKEDTLWNIAKQFGTTVDDIVRTNAIEDANKIIPGQKIYIPKYVKPITNQEKVIVADYV